MGLLGEVGPSGGRSRLVVVCSCEWPWSPPGPGGTCQLGSDTPGCHFQLPLHTLRQALLLVPISCWLWTWFCSKNIGLGGTIGSGPRIPRLGEAVTGTQRAHPLTLWKPSGHSLCFQTGRRASYSSHLVISAVNIGWDRDVYKWEGFGCGALARGSQQVTVELS